MRNQTSNLHTLGNSAIKSTSVTSVDSTHIILAKIKIYGQQIIGNMRDKDRFEITATSYHEHIFVMHS